MTYRDNDVYFSMSKEYLLIRGVYTVTDFSVTEGQDPDRNIYVGLKVSCSDSDKMSFRIGRKGSESVAQWFNDKVPASQNTFNHSAGKLNFAFLGTLELTIRGGILGNRQETFTFLNVALAQGKSGTSNNWWFGGSNGSYAQSNSVIYSGTNAKGSAVSFVFQRGGNSVDMVGVSPEKLVDTANWMKQVNDSVKLDQIMMPGSHDAGMSELSHCAPPGLADGYTKTQSGSIGQQLADGSRYFDIRVDYDYNALVTYHRTKQWGCNGQGLVQVLDQVKTFLTAHPSETAILKFSHIRDYDDHDPAVTKQKINELLNSYSDFIYVNASGSINLAEVILGNTRGKMILVFDYSEFIDPASGRFRYKNGDSIQSGANVTVYDRYSDTSDYEEMKNDQLQKWNEYGGLGRGYLFLLSWTLTPEPPGKTVSTLAAEANAQLAGVLYDQIMIANAGKPNIVYIDFLNSTVTQSIILYNLQ
ncbi:hypothetical protein FNH22_29130 [Fulvivirga sp. M361]|uniref:hypothetical protein n=1 Tax=Fulvivirga sp. M361 TaxID=2594266 RepID=UPI00117B2BF3|nr:hypothetical protein [Fulvivirga sp. M361]TRX48382.1 hypothetical protein FNH22_29130 [Fulvivirga sp. M361]